MRLMVWALVIVCTTVIQATIMPLLTIKGVSPDLLLIIVVSASLLFGKDHGVCIGFFAGLIQDLASGNIFGVNIIAKLSIGYLFGLAERKVFKEHILLPVITVGVATVMSGFIAISFLMVLGYKIEFMSALTNRVFPAVLYNMVLSIPIHKAIYNFSQKLNKV